MKLVGRERLHEFCEQHADARQWVETWLAEVANASWATPADIKQRYASVSILADNKVIFNVKGNDYRMEATIAYRTGIVVVEWVGTHARYDRRYKRR